MSALVPHDNCLDCIHANNDGFNCINCNWQCRHCLLLFVATVPSSGAHATFAAMLFTSLSNYIKDIIIL